MKWQGKQAALGQQSVSTSYSFATESTVAVGDNGWSCSHLIQSMLPVLSGDLARFVRRPMKIQQALAEGVALCTPTGRASSAIRTVANHALARYRTVG